MTEWWPNRFELNLRGTSTPFLTLSSFTKITMRCKRSFLQERECKFSMRNFSGIFWVYWKHTNFAQLLICSIDYDRTHIVHILYPPQMKSSESTTSVSWSLAEFESNQSKLRLANSAIAFGIIYRPLTVLIWSAVILILESKTKVFIIWVAQNYFWQLRKYVYALDLTELIFLKLF